MTLATFRIKSFGCQMNVYDGDRMAELLGHHGMTAAGDGEDAEVVSVHWRHHPHDAWLSGADVEAEVVEGLVGLGWRHRVRHDDRDFVVDGLERGR